MKKNKPKKDKTTATNTTNGSREDSKRAQVTRSNNTKQHFSLAVT